MYKKKYQILVLKRNMRIINCNEWPFFFFSRPPVPFHEINVLLRHYTGIKRMSGIHALLLVSRVQNAKTYHGPKVLRIAYNIETKGPQRKRSISLADIRLSFYLSIYILTGFLNKMGSPGFKPCAATEERIAVW